MISSLLLPLPIPLESLQVNDQHVGMVQQSQLLRERGRRRRTPLTPPPGIVLPYPLDLREVTKTIVQRQTPCARFHFRHLHRGARTSPQTPYAFRVPSIKRPSVPRHRTGEVVEQTWLVRIVVVVVTTYLPPNIRSPLPKRGRRSSARCAERECPERGPDIGPPFVSCGRIAHTSSPTATSLRKTPSVRPNPPPRTARQNNSVLTGKGIGDPGRLLVL